MAGHRGEWQGDAALPHLRLPIGAIIGRMGREALAPTHSSGRVAGWLRCGATGGRWRLAAQRCQFSSILTHFLGENGWEKIRDRVTAPVFPSSVFLWSISWWKMMTVEHRLNVPPPPPPPPVPLPLPSILATKTRSTSVTSQLNPPPFLNAYLRRPCGFLILMNPHLLVLNSIRPFGSDDVVIGGPMPWLLPCCHVAMLPLTVWWLWMIKAVSISITSQ